MRSLGISLAAVTQDLGIQAMQTSALPIEAPLAPVRSYHASRLLRPALPAGRQRVRIMGILQANDLQHDGSFHRITLETPDRVATATIRSGYYAPTH